MTNSADPDQLASSEANWSGSTLFANAGHFRVQQNQGFTTPLPNPQQAVSADRSKAVFFGSLIAIESLYLFIVCSPSLLQAMSLEGCAFVIVDFPG